MNALNANTSGSKNTAVGVNSLKKNTSSINNVAVGIASMRDNTTGTDNTALGAYALMRQTVNVYENVAIGSHALTNNDSGGANTAIGSYALNSATNVNNNVAIGKNAGENLTGSGSANNVFIGKGAKTVSGTVLNNATALGSDAVVSSDHTVVLGDQDVTKWAFGLQTTDSGKAIQVGDDSSNGNGAYLTTGGTWTNASSKNLKTNFLSFVDDWFFEKIKNLTILKWDYIGTNETHIGPTSEEFIEAFGVGDGIDDSHLSTLDVSGVALRGVQGLIHRDESQEKEIKDLKSEIEELKSQKKINELKSEIEELKAQIETLKSIVQSKK